MAESGNSMLYSLLLFVVTLSLQEMYRGKLASSELFTIIGGFTSSLVFLFLLTVSSLLSCDDIHRLVCVCVCVLFIFNFCWSVDISMFFSSSVIAMMHGNLCGLKFFVNGINCLFFNIGNCYLIFLSLFGFKPKVSSEYVKLTFRWLCATTASTCTRYRCLMPMYNVVSSGQVISVIWNTKNNGRWEKPLGN